MKMFKKSKGIRSAAILVLLFQSSSFAMAINTTANELIPVLPEYEQLYNQFGFFQSGSCGEENKTWVQMVSSKLYPTPLPRSSDGMAQRAYLNLMLHQNSTFTATYIEEREAFVRSSFRAEFVRYDLIGFGGYVYFLPGGDWYFEGLGVARVTPGSGQLALSLKVEKDFLTSSVKGKSVLLPISKTVYSQEAGDEYCSRLKK
jgi:hypothetical protein